MSVRRTGGDVLFSTLLLDNNDDGDNDGGDRSEKDAAASLMGAPVWYVSLWDTLSRSGSSIASCRPGRCCYQGQDQNAYGYGRRC